jgi:hypothetical protein
MNSFASVSVSVIVVILFPFSGAVASKQPVVGRKAASKYFEPRLDTKLSKYAGPTDHYLAVHIGSFTQTESYLWDGQEKRENLGRLSMGVTYLLSQWTPGVDLLFRADVNSYELGEERLSKITILPVLIFPEAKSRFPLYFGAGLGPGVFFKQIRDESVVTLDLQVFMGMRFLNLSDNTGFFIESGIKNHIHLLSDGQFNGVYFVMGSVFTF